MKSAEGVLVYENFSRFQLGLLHVFIFRNVGFPKFVADDRFSFRPFSCRWES